MQNASDISIPQSHGVDYVKERDQLAARLDTYYLRAEVDFVERQAAREAEQPPRVTESVGNIAPRRPVDFDEMGLDSILWHDNAANRANGDFFPIFGNEWDVAALRGMGRHLAESSIGKAALENLANYAVHTGYEYTVAAKRKEHAPKGLVEECQHLVDVTIAANSWDLEFEREIFDACRVDGEAVLALESDSRDVRIRRAEPSWMTQPAGDVSRWEQKLNCPHRLDWRYGIATDATDATAVYGYSIQWNGDPGEWKFYHKNRVAHLKFNTPRHVKRGLTDFFPVDGDAVNSLELRRRMLEGSGVQASIALVVAEEMGNGSLGVGAGKTYGTLRTMNPGGTGRGRNADGSVGIQRYSNIPSSTIINTRGQKYHAGPMAGTQAANFVQVLQAGQRAVGVRWCMPEHMISGDASNNNYASILEAGTPFTRAIEARQQVQCTKYERLFWSVLRVYFDLGLLNLQKYGMTWRDLRQAIAIHINGPSPSNKDTAAEFTRDQYLFENGLVSAESLATKYDWDFEEEKDKGAKPQIALPPAPAQADNAAAKLEDAPQPQAKPTEVEPPQGDPRSREGMQRAIEAAMESWEGWP